MRRIRALLTLSALALVTTTSAACNLDNLGDPPPPADIYLPTGLMLSAQSGEVAPRYLYVFNSNFDLRYNRGSVQAFDLDRVGDALDDCKDKPDVECVIDTHDEGILADEVLVPAHATSFAVSPDRRRMYVATRTDPSLLFIDLDEAGDTGDGTQVFDCDQTDRRCSETHQRGLDGSSLRESVFPTEPVGMVSVPLAAAEAIAPGEVPAQASDNFLLVAHRTGRVSLFYDQVGQGPQLIHVVEGLGLEPTGITFDVASRLAYLSVFSRSGISGQERWLLRVGLIEQAPIETSFTYDAATVIVDGVAPQRDTRAVAMSPTTPGQVLIASRDPAAILTVDVGTATPDAPSTLPSISVPTRRVTPVGSGPTRMAFGQLDDRQIMAVSCFDGHSVYILDVQSSELLGIVHNLNGPFELGIDSVRQRMYIADFRSSSVQVIDISSLADPDVNDTARTDPRIVATLGIPKVVQELQ